MTTAKKAASDNTAKQAEAAVAAGKKGVETVMKAGTEAVTKTYERTAAVTKEQVDAAFKACETTFKDVDGYKDIAAFGKQNVDAAFKSSTAAMKGMQELNKAYTAMFQASMDLGLAATQAAFACTTVKEFSELQADFAKKQYGEIQSDGHALAGLTVKIAEKTFAPLRERVDAAVEILANPPSV